MSRQRALSAIVGLRTRALEDLESERPPLPGAAFCGFASAQTEKVVEFFLERDAAEAMIREVREEEPALAADLRVEIVELD